MWSETGMVDQGSLVVGIEENESHELSNVFGILLRVLILPSLKGVSIETAIVESEGGTEINIDEVT
jgi:hypothetical protein